MKPIVLVCPIIPPSRDGVGDYTYCLAAEIAKTRPVAIVTTQQRLPDSDDSGLAIHRWDGRFRSLLHLCSILQPEFVNIQWVPSQWTRFGFNPSLPSMALRLRWAGYRVVTTIHETYVGFDHWKHFVVGPLQRLTLWPLVMASSKVAAASQSYVTAMQRIVPWRPDDVFWLPVGSNMPKVEMTEAERAEFRRALGIAADVLVVATFSPFAAGRDIHLFAAAWRRISSEHPKAHLLLVGVTREDVAERLPLVSATEQMTCTGYLSRTQVSRCLGLADIFIAPFRGGLSCKRGSVMAALQHELAIVTTRGAMTEPGVFDAAPMVMTNADSQQAYVDACAKLANDRETRSRLAAAASDFYRRQFDWPVVASLLTARCADGS